MTHHRLSRRFARLEKHAEEIYRHLRRQEQRREEWERSVLALFGAFPEDRHEKLFDVMKSAGWEKTGVGLLYNRIDRGFWKPMPIPGVVTAVYLSELEAQPDAHCDRCQLLLPYRRGIWTNHETGKSYQAPLVYMRTCPCGGRILDAGDHDCGWKALPERVVPPWTFLDWRDECAQKQAAERNEVSP